MPVHSKDRARFTSSGHASAQTRLPVDRIELRFTGRQNIPTHYSYISAGEFPSLSMEGLTCVDYALINLLSFYSLDDELEEGYKPWQVHNLLISLSDKMIANDIQLKPSAIKKAYQHAPEQFKEWEPIIHPTDESRKRQHVLCYSPDEYHFLQSPCFKNAAVVAFLLKTNAKPAVYDLSKANKKQALEAALNKKHPMLIGWLDYATTAENKSRTLLINHLNLTDDPQLKKMKDGHIVAVIPSSNMEDVFILDPLMPGPAKVSKQAVVTAICNYSEKGDIAIVPQQKPDLSLLEK